MKLIETTFLDVQPYWALLETRRESTMKHWSVTCQVAV
jgi:hypothetical protein